MKKIFILLLQLTSLQLFSQAIYYVKPSGSDGNSGASWGHAFRTLKKALAAASSGQIWVAAGTYYPDEGPGQTNNDRNASFSLKNNVAIYGGFAGNEAQLSQRDWHTHETILSGDIDHETKPGDNSGNAYHVVRNSSVNNTALLDGFTITGGNANATGTTNVCGGGMHNIYCSPTISHCTFWGNTCWAGNWYSLIDGGGGAMYNFRSSPIITGCIFTSNSSGDFGGAISNDIYSSPTISYCTFSGNECSWGAYGGGALFNFGNSSPNIVNCLFYRNHSRGSGGAISNGSSSSPAITQCTFWGNIANDWGAIANEDSYAKITNCILWGNIDNLGRYTAQVYNHYSSATVTYSIVQGGYGTGNLNSDPLFVNAAGGNFHVQCNSPAVDAGDNEAVSGTDTTDLDGLPRIGNNRVDIGAYEKQFVLYVKANATGLNNGTSWANAFTKLQDALAKASLCNQIWVAKGTYYPDEGAGLTNNDRTLSFALKNGIALYGGFEGTENELFMRNPQFNETILSGDIDGIAGNSGNAYHVVTATSVDSTAILDGFTIQEGYAGATNYNYGGGMYNISATPVVVNCTFKDNVATTGGALFNQASSPTLTNCNFVNNRANSGGAMYNRSTIPASSNSSPVINGCSFSTNMVTIEGGAIYNDGSSGTVVNCVFSGNGAVTGAGLFNQYTNDLKIINCTFAMNSASSSGGAIYNWNNYTSRPTITNCILWNDTKGEIAGDPAIVSYSIVQLGYSTGSNIITADPLFVVNGYSLMIGSPAIDAGNDAAVPAGITTDLRGGNRINGIHVDMGAYEYASAGGPPGPTKPLTITCPTDTTVAADPESCGAMVDYFESHPALVMGGKRPVTVTYSPASPSFLPVGVNTMTVTATDSTGDMKSCSFMITVVDTTSSTITGVSATPSVLYPPNHKLVEVVVNYNTSDCTPVTTTLSISSNEAINSSGDGNTTSDWQVIDNHLVKLRAERSGNGTDRVYTITITAVDSSGNISIATTMVTVPHDKAPVTVSPGTSELKEGAGKLQISVMPNPTSSFFTINTTSASDQPLEITITDAVGRIVEVRHGLDANSSIQVGQNYRPGIYLVQVIQGEQRVVIKLMKKTE